MRFYFLRLLRRLFLAFCLLLVMFNTTNNLTFVQAQGQFNLRKFDILDSHSGWILLDQHLFWTADAGQTWNEISQSMPTDALIQDVRFVDANYGWVLWTMSN